jgi:hypothetical protein
VKANGSFPFLASSVLVPVLVVAPWDRMAVDSPDQPFDQESADYHRQGQLLGLAAAIQSGRLDFGCRPTAEVRVFGNRTLQVPVTEPLCQELSFAVG